MIKVLFTAAEAAPFVKTGGLADVASSLPKALKKMGVDIRVMIPNYSCIPEEFKTEMKLIKSFGIPLGTKQEYCGVLYMEFDGVTYYFIDNEKYFKREGIYGFYDDEEKFAYFDKAILESIKHIDFIPDIIHLNDWHTGMVSLLLKEHYKGEPEYSKIKTVFTIHNLRYQGIFSADILDRVLNLDMKYFDTEALEFYGGVSFMKGGINYSDIVTTVSKTYGKEIQTSEYGERLDGLLKKNKHRLFGIVNGIDYNIYNPKTDKDIFVNYNMSSLEKKVENKLMLQEFLNLPKNKDIPMIGMVTRLAHMKGIDLVIQKLDEILESDVQMVILGTGEPHLQTVLKDYSLKYPDRLSVNIMFDNSMAHKIYAASDIFLMPSKFEPCGLSQLIALRYGTVPVVRETGGLKDTVKPYNELTGKGNGFTFAEFNADDMLCTVKRALKLYKEKETWTKIVKNAMKGDYSWKGSAYEYRELYKKLIQEI